MNKKIIYYSILLCLLAITVGLGLYNLFSPTSYKNNEVSFKVNTQDAYFQAWGDYYGITDEPTSTYVGAKYTQEDFYQGVVPSFSVWSLGTSEFVIDEVNPENEVTELKYIISIKNLNLDKSLNIDVKGVAVHPNNHFITSIHYKSSSIDEEVFSTDPNSHGYLYKDVYYNLDKTTDSDDRYVNIVNQQLVSGDTLEITICLTLNTKTKEFTLDNNITFEMSAVNN